jgi:hypothetical protein
MIPILHNWLTYPLSVLMPGACIVGMLCRDSDPRQPIKRVRTSRVIEVHGDCVRTKSGNRYRLGKMDAAFAEWVRKEGKSA